METMGGLAFLELEFLQQLKIVEVFGIVLGRSLPAAREPVWQRPCRRRPRDGVSAPNC